METLSRLPLTLAGFRDRREAGRLLARELLERDVVDVAAGKLVVIGLARGGVEVAAEIKGWDKHPVAGPRIGRRVRRQ